MKLISLNIEGYKHLERVIPFIEREKPDVLCILEVLSVHLPLFEARGFDIVFSPMTKKLYEGSRVEEGIALCTLRDRVRTRTYSSQYYRGTADTITDFDKGSFDRYVSYHINHSVIFADVEVDSQQFTIATTHFTWTPDGDKPSLEQTEDVEKLLTITQEHKPHIICGDFNIPRNISLLYSRLTEHYTDMIPTKYASSLDPVLHKLHNNPEKKHLFSSFMVDYLFSNADYSVSGVRLEFGLSDHAAIVATVE